MTNSNCVPSGSTETLTFLDRSVNLNLKLEIPDTIIFQAAKAYLLRTVENTVTK